MDTTPGNAPASSGRARVLEALLELTGDGWPASVRDVAARAGVSSSSNVHYHLHDLAADGLAEQHPRNPNLGWRATAEARASLR